MLRRGISAAAMRLNSLMVISPLLVALVFAHSSTHAIAFESHFEIDPSVKESLAQIARNHVTATRSGRSGDLYSADASAVLKVNPAKLFAAAQDYDHYVAFGMPHLDEARVVERASPDLLFTFASMSYATMSSRHYLEVRLHPNLSPAGAMGMEWQLAQRHPGWPYNDSPAFSRMDGSFYLEPLADGNVYIRYFLANNVNMPGIFSSIIQRALRSGAADVIMVLARQAKVQP